jgi:hypothetical protein
MVQGLPYRTHLKVVQDLLQHALQAASQQPGGTHASTTATPAGNITVGAAASTFSSAPPARQQQQQGQQQQHSLHLRSFSAVQVSSDARLLENLPVHSMTLLDYTVHNSIGLSLKALAQLTKFKKLGSL